MPNPPPPPGAPAPTVTTATYTAVPAHGRFGGFLPPPPNGAGDYPSFPLVDTSDDDEAPTDDEACAPTG